MGQTLGHVPHQTVANRDAQKGLFPALSHERRLALISGLTELLRLRGRRPSPVRPWDLPLCSRMMTTTSST